jgi:hypothetical protein
MNQPNCLHCNYLSRKLGRGNYFIYKCNYWGLVTQKVLPQSVVISSIGKRCPFYREKVKMNKNKKNEDNGNDGGLDVIV